MFTMEYKGFSAVIQKAERLVGDYVHGLPPGKPINVYPVDAFEKPLGNWVKGAGNYVVPVESDWGLWFDWTMNDYLNTAILPTVKGMNPITGQRTNGFALERYEEKCPVHKIKFKDGLFCEKCNFKWPKQNYVASPNTLWWDGFRTSDGKVRQFFFTEDLLKSIPEQVIGKEDTVPAFGFAFYQTKVRREWPKQKGSRTGIGVTGPMGSKGSIGQNYWFHPMAGTGKPAPGIYTCQIDNDTIVGANSVQVDSGEITLSNNGSSASFDNDSVKCMYINSSGNISLGTSNPTTKLKLDGDGFLRTVKTKKQVKNAEVGVGAGAEIAQGLEIDSLKLSDWQDKPSSVMRLYFVFTDQFKSIADKGMKDLTGEKEGYLAGLKTG